jgi:cysteinyl-tRNA synthetase
MELKLYDTLTREKRVFKPLDPANVRMYVCGPTVYDFAHIGNARPVIVFDVLFRLLRHLYGAEHVTYVRNITDVDDKINARAAEEFPDLPLNEAIRKVTEETEAQFHKDTDTLGCQQPTLEPRATEYINRPDAPIDMVRLISLLLQNRNAYLAEGHVLFDVSTMPDYGMLVRQPLDQMISGARVDPAPFKRNPMDFVLWKPSTPGEPSWPSPWGQGRPGWHIECSAMAAATLGKMFDIHGGGIDLLFPHHENEIAQTRCAFHTPTMANYWMHNGFLQVHGTKMSKSEGNFVTIRDLLTGWSGRPWAGKTVRLAMIDSLYSQPINWTPGKLADAEVELFRFASGMFGLSANLFGNDLARFTRFVLDAPRTIPSEFLEALCDDLNTPLALSYVRQRYHLMQNNAELAIEVLNSLELLGVVSRDEIFLNQPPGTLKIFDRDELGVALRLGREFTIALQNKDIAQAEVIKTALLARSIVPKHYGLGLFILEKTHADAGLESKIKELLEARDSARRAKDFKESDRIRDELAKMGIVLKDGKDGTTWEIAR